jgi:hypothetical protein
VTVCGTAIRLQVVGGLGFLPGCVRLMCIRDREALAWIDRQITLVCKYHVGNDFQADEGRQELV